VCTDFDAKYVKRRGSAQGSAFWGSRNQNLRFRPPFPPKPPFSGPISTGLGIFSPENGFNIRRLESKRPLIVVVVNRQIGVGDSKYVIVFDPLLTGHVIRRMRSVSVRIFNGNQWETLTLITQERISVGASNLVGIIDVGVDACGILSRSVGQTNRK